MSKPFSDKFIASRKIEEKKYYVRGSEKGFALAVHPTGIKTFMYIYTLAAGKRRHLSLGTYPACTLAEARLKYHDAFKQVSRGEDPQAQKSEGEDLTFGRFAKDMLSGSKERHSPGHYRTIKLSLDNDLLPYWKDRLITDIKRRDVIELLERVAARSPGQTPNVNRAAGYVFEYAVQRDYIPGNPMKGLTKVVPALKYVPRDRALSEPEIKVVWRAIDEGSGDEGTKRALKLVLVTAQRPGEVTGMHRREIEGEWWTIPKERAEKGQGDHLVYLTPMALKLIGDARGYIFPSFQEGKHIQCQALTHMIGSKTRKKEPFYGLPRFTGHDMRRTARTHMARIGIIDEHAEAVLAHCKQGIKRVYNLHDYRDEKKKAMLKLEEELLKIVG